MIYVINYLKIIFYSIQCLFLFSIKYFVYYVLLFFVDCSYDYNGSNYDFIFQRSNNTK